jgi:hypothetical protein
LIILIILVEEYTLSSEYFILKFWRLW